MGDYPQFRRAVDAAGRVARDVAGGRVERETARVRRVVRTRGAVEHDRRGAVREVAVHAERRGRRRRSRGRSEGGVSVPARRPVYAVESFRVVVAREGRRERTRHAAVVPPPRDRGAAFDRDREAAAPVSGHDRRVRDDDEDGRGERRRGGGGGR
eukprot:30860-Pelagococcus_subviridis.AAC.13